jgi:hypothetical protein
MADFDGGGSWNFGLHLNQTISNLNWPLAKGYPSGQGANSDSRFSSPFQLD